MQFSFSVGKLVVVSLVTLLLSLSSKAHADSSAAVQAVELGKSLEKLGKADEALNAYKLACDLAYGPGCRFAAGLVAQNGTGASSRTQKQFARQACELDDAGGCSEYGRLTGGASGEHLDHTVSRASFKKACEIGKGPTDCRRYANMLEAGLGGARDLKAARDVLETTCRKSRNSQPACVDLARFLGSGFAGPKDPDRQVDLLKKACDANVAHACSDLGSLTQDGIVIWDKTGNAVERFVLKPDMEQAVALYEKACSIKTYRARPERGCASLAIHLATSGENPEDMDRALQMTVDGCESLWSPWICWGASETLKIAISYGHFDENESSAASEKALKMAERGCDTGVYGIEEYERRSGILASCSEVDYRACMNRGGERLFYSITDYEDCSFYAYRDQEIDWPLAQ